MHVNSHVAHEVPDIMDDITVKYGSYTNTRGNELNIRWARLRRAVPARERLVLLIVTVNRKLEAGGSIQKSKNRSCLGGIRIKLPLFFFFSRSGKGREGERDKRADESE